MGIENWLLTAGVAAITAWLVAGGRHRRLRHHGHQAHACPCGCIDEAGGEAEKNHD